MVTDLTATCLLRRSPRCRGPARLALHVRSWPRRARLDLGLAIYRRPVEPGCASPSSVGPRAGFGNPRRRALTRCHLALARVSGDHCRHPYRDEQSGQFDAELSDVAGRSWIVSPARLPVLGLMPTMPWHDDPPCFYPLQYATAGSQVSLPSAPICRAQPELDGWSAIRQLHGPNSPNAEPGARWSPTPKL
jgi:hypothetical protein